MGDICDKCLSCYCDCDAFTPRDYACFGYGSVCELEEPGCAVGCTVCFDDAGTQPSHVHGVQSTGRRWARPAEIERRPRLMTRDAWGWVSPLVSNLTTLVTRDTIFQVAQCFDRRGGECFENAERDGPCRCTFHKRLLCDPDFLCENNRQADLLTFSDCTWMHGMGSIRGVPGIECRRCGDARIHWISPRFGLLTGSRMGNLAEARTTSCVSNQMVACIGAVPTGQRCCEVDDRVTYYNPGQASQLFSTFELDWGGDEDGPHFEKPDDASPELRAQIDIKNAALAYVREHADELPGGQNDSVDTLYHDLPPGGGRNAFLDTWEGRCISEGCEERVILDLPGSHLRFSGAPITAQVVLETVVINVSFFMHAIEDGRDDREGDQIRPGGRIDIELHLAIRCDFPGDPPEGLEFFDDRFSCSRKRIVGGRDHIILKTAGGVTVQVPEVIRWRGGRTEWTMSQFPEHHPHEHLAFCGGFATHTQCCRYAAQMTLEDGCRGTHWPAMPSRYPDRPTRRPDAVLEADIWKGGVRLRIPLHKFEDHCPAECDEGVRDRCGG